MGLVDLIPICGGMKEYRARSTTTYHKLKKSTMVTDQVSDYCSDNNVAILNPNVKMVQVVVIPKAGHRSPKMTMRLLSMNNLLKRFRDAYVQGMLGLAAHVAHLNNGEICFLNKIDQ